MGNVVGLPQMVIPVDFEPVALGSARQQPITVGIYALPNQDSKVQPCMPLSLSPVQTCTDWYAFVSQPVCFARNVMHLE